MFDRDTLVVTYDPVRGEPRSAKSAKNAKTIDDTIAENKKGDCIDCSLCVQVCPTGIDIRDGLQYECIGCAACIDACDSVMDKVGKPQGLIRYDTEYALDRRAPWIEVRKRMLRPRVLGYGAVLLLMAGGMSTALALRTPLKLDVIRDRGAMGREVDDGQIENVYRLQVMNTGETAHRFRIGVAGVEGAHIVDADVVALPGATTRAVPVRVRAQAGRHGSNPIRFTVTALDDPSLSVTEKAVFIAPR
jgi:cytochrome c oxidase accessory protein FixG